MIMLFIHTLSNRTHAFDCTADYNWVDETWRVKQTYSPEVMWNSIFIAIWIHSIFPYQSLLGFTKRDKAVCLTVWKLDVPSIVMDFLFQFGKIDRAMVEEAFCYYVASQYTNYTWMISWDGGSFNADSHLTFWINYRNIV